MKRFRPKGAFGILTLLVLGGLLELPAHGADSPPAASPGIGDKAIRLEPISVGALPVMSFGFSVQIIKNGTTKKVASMMVNSVGRGSQAELDGLKYYTQILSIDGLTPDSQTPRFVTLYIMNDPGWFTDQFR